MKCNTIYWVFRREKMLDREKIRTLIKESGATKRQIAIKAGINVHNLYKFLNGNQQGMNADTAFKLADALEVDINKFREG